jgi:Glyoxalase/Bleomycin resistance protein/Dioxygenase superfamily
VQAVRSSVRCVYAFAVFIYIHIHLLLLSLLYSVYKACDSIREMGYGFRKEPDGGSMKGLAFAYDPDGYSVEIIKRGGIDFGDQRKDA